MMAVMETVLPVATRFRLREIMDSASPPISQRELARRSGVSPTTVNRMYANLTAQVSLATLDALSAALGCAPGDLIERVEDRKKRR